MSWHRLRIQFGNLRVYLYPRFMIGYYNDMKDIMYLGIWMNLRMPMQCINIRNVLERICVSKLPAKCAHFKAILFRDLEVISENDFFYGLTACGAEIFVCGPIWPKIHNSFVQSRSRSTSICMMAL